MRTQLMELLLHAAIYALLLPFVTPSAAIRARLATHAILLAGYNTNVPPVTNSRSSNNVAVSDAGTDIQLQLRVFKVDAVDAAHGQMSLKIWLRHSWVDKRLAWNETEWGGINMIALDRPAAGDLATRLTAVQFAHIDRRLPRVHRCERLL